MKPARPRPASCRSFSRFTHAALMGSTALILSTGFALAQELPTSSNINQTNSSTTQTNTLNVTTDGQVFFLNSTDGVAVQNATGGSNTLNIDLSNTSYNNTDPNFIFVTQNGNVTSSITIDGGANTVFMREFASTAVASAQTIFITGDGNTVDASTNGSENYGLLDLNLNSDVTVVSVTNDEFSNIYLNVIGSADSVTVTQDNGTSVADANYFNEVTVDITSTGAQEFINNDVTISQLGINNLLDFDLIGDGNDITVNQTNDIATSQGISDLTVYVDDDDSTLVISTFGAGTNVFSIRGTGSNITVNSDTNSGTDFSSVNAVSDIRVNGDLNTVTAVDFDDVTIRIGDVGTVALNYGNTVSTSGNVDVAVDGATNILDFTNGYTGGYQPVVSIGAVYAEATGNDLTLVNRTTVGLVSNLYSFVVNGDLNVTGTGGFGTIDIGSVDVALSGNQNSITGELLGLSGLSVIVTGDTNDLLLDGEGGAEEGLDITVNGSSNNIGVIMAGGGVSHVLDYLGDDNDFDYSLGAQNLSHKVYGNGYAGSVDATSSGYSAGFTRIGFGYVDMNSNGSSLLIVSGCTYGSDCPGDA